MGLSPLHLLKEGPQTQTDNLENRPSIRETVCTKPATALTAERAYRNHHESGICLKETVVRPLQEQQKEACGWSLWRRSGRSGCCS